DPPVGDTRGDPGPPPAPGPAQPRDLRRARLFRRRDRFLYGSCRRRARGEGVLMHALEGVRLIDFGQYLAGPLGPVPIGDLGADVIKVEPVSGDGMRMAGGPFFGCQRGKRSLALDLKNPRGVEIALQLVERAD